MSSVLIIDDEASLVRSFIFALKAQGYEAHGAHNGAAGLDAAARLHPSVVLLDLRLPDLSGMEVLERLHSEYPDMPIIIISAHGDTRAAVKAVKGGAADYLTKPFELDDLFHVIASVLDRQQMSNELAFHRQVTVGAGELVGGSAVMQTLNDTVRRIAASNSGRILLLGESGTGKALVARAVHSCSMRANGPFIEINCASLPEQLIEAELFGAEKGSYTGAHQKRVGLVTLANGGTLFLDEIGELPLPLQAKFLHFLENGSYRPIGFGRTLTTDVRVVAATNRDLAEEVRQGHFREDLYFRLNVIHIAIPPLRDRREDIPSLVAHFSTIYAREENCPPIRLAADAQSVFRNYGWPGNVRELKNLIERLTILMPGRLVSVNDLPPEMRANKTATDAPASPGSLDSQMADAERQLLQNALREAGGRKNRAADLLGISRHALKRRLQRLGLG